MFVLVGPAPLAWRGIGGQIAFLEESRMQIGAGLIWIALLPLADQATAKPNAVPVFNVAPSCLEAREYAGSNRNLTYQGCMKDENEAHAELVRKWAHFKEGDRRDCVAQGAAPMPSYVEILTCLEMSDEAGALYNPDGTARAKPDRATQGLSGPNLPAPSGDLPGPAAPPGSDGIPKPEDVAPAPKAVE
jgi:hypothetical protein